MKKIKIIIISMCIITSFTTIVFAEKIDITKSNKNIINSLTIDNIIIIDGNNGFKNCPWVLNPDALGTEGDPYIIDGENFNFNWIEISNTNVYFKIRNCKIIDYDTHQARKLQLENVAYATVQNCTIIAKDGTFCFVYLEDSVIEYCNISTYDTAFALLHSNNNIIRHCTILNCGLVGFELIDSNNGNIIHDCIIKNSYYYGFWLYIENNGNEIHNCKILKCLTAFQIDFSSNDNIIHHCEVLRCDKKGFRLIESHRNTIYMCNITGGKPDDIFGNVGISLAGSQDNKIYYNNVLNFSKDANIDGMILTNQWDDGEKIGNYWENFKGIDINKDGISEKEYVITFENTDYFPLMKPYNGSKSKIKTQALLINNNNLYRDLNSFFPLFKQLLKLPFFKLTLK